MKCPTRETMQKAMGQIATTTLFIAGVQGLGFRLGLSV